MSLLLNDAGRSPAELRRLAAAAWNATKSAEEPVFESCVPGFQESLLARTADVLTTGEQSEFALAVHAADNLEPAQPVVDTAPLPEPTPDAEPEPIKPKTRGRKP